MSEFSKEPRPRSGWPAQPPQYTSQPAWQAGYGADGSGADGYGQPADGGAGDGQAGYSDYANGQRRYGRLSRRRGRGWIALLVTLFVLAVLFIIGDQVARAYAQNMIAGKLQSSSGLAAKPAVSIPGFPFLTQLAAHDIGTVNISASNVQAGKLNISTVNATATGVHLNSSFNGATIDHIAGTALITFGALENAAGAQGVTISADPARGPNAATVSVGPLSATARVAQSGPNQITITMEGLNGIASSLIGSLPNYTITVPALPAGLHMTGVSVTSQGISVSVAAQHTTLSQ